MGDTASGPTPLFTPIYLAFNMAAKERPVSDGALSFSRPTYISVKIRAGTGNQDPIPAFSFRQNCPEEYIAFVTTCAENESILQQKFPFILLI